MKFPLRFEALTLLCLFLAMASGCAIDYPVRINRIMPPASGKKVSRQISIVANEELKEATYEASGMLWVGTAHTWRTRSGHAVAKSATEICKVQFETVEQIGTKPRPEDQKDLVLIPYLKRISTDPVSMGTSLVIDYRIEDRSGNLILEANGSGESGFGGAQFGAVMFGVMAGKAAMSSSVSEAFNLANEDFSRKLEEAIAKGVFDNPAYPVKTPELPDSGQTPQMPPSPPENRAPEVSQPEVPQSLPPPGAAYVQ